MRLNGGYAWICIVCVGMVMRNVMVYGVLVYCENVVVLLYMMVYVSCVVVYACVLLS